MTERVTRRCRTAAASVWTTSTVRILTAVLATVGLLVVASTIAAPRAVAGDCRQVLNFTMVEGGYWADYEALYVPPSAGPVTQTITTTRTHSTTTTVTPELGVTVDVFVAELNAKMGGSYAVTATVASGRSTTVTAPASSANQEIRFGTFKQKFDVEISYWGGCGGPTPPPRHTIEYAAKPSAGVVTL